MEQKSSDAPAPRDSRGGFLRGNPIGASTRFPPGRSGNPEGVSRLRKQFEAAFYTAMTDPDTINEALDALRKAIRTGESWAIQLLFSKLLPAAPIAVQMEVSRRDEIDFSRITDAELEQLEAIAERVVESGDAESGAGAPESPAVHRGSEAGL